MASENKPHRPFKMCSPSEKLNHSIECITCYEKSSESGVETIIFVGTRNGSLLEYRADILNGCFTLDLVYSQKNFSKKPIIQLLVLYEQNHLLCLTDGFVWVYNLTDRSLIQKVNETKGAILLTLEHRVVDIKRKKNPGRICILLNRTIELYHWKSRYIYMRSFIVVEQPKCLLWHLRNIFIGLKNDYYRVNINDGSVKEIFSGYSPYPAIEAVGSSSLAFSRDKATYLITDFDGVDQTINWTESPYNITFFSPFLIGFMFSKVVVYEMESFTLIDNIETKKTFKSICKTSKAIFLLTSDGIYALSLVPIFQQINSLLQSHNFSLAIRIQNDIGERSTDDIVYRRINQRKAFHLFSSRQYDEAFQTFKFLDIDPLHIIGIYWKLVSSEFLTRANIPQFNLDIEENVIYSTQSLAALIKFLYSYRVKLENGHKIGCYPLFGDVSMVSSSLSTIIDTILLCCHIRIDDRIVVSLLRVKNSCDISESERILEGSDHVNELLILYRINNLHLRAFNLLQNRITNKVESSVSAIPDLQLYVDYLELMEPHNRSIVFQQLMWIWDMCKWKKGILHILTSHLMSETNQLQLRVLQFIDEKIPSLRLEYLEKQVLEIDTKERYLHNELCTMYMDSINSENSADRILRDNFKTLLSSSNLYDPAEVMNRLPKIGFYEEKSVVYEKMGLHSAALAVIIFVLNDYKNALRYCGRHKGENLYNILFVLLTSKEEEHIDPDFMDKDVSNFMTDMLNRHSDKLDCSIVLSNISEDVPLVKVGGYLSKVLNYHQKSSFPMRKHLTEHFSALAMEDHRRTSTTSVTITTDTICVGCLKNIGQSAFVLLPDGSLQHYFCYSKS